MKFQRQAKILELVDRFEIETQEELTDHLRALGYNTTQATVSRDIKELRLIKSLSAETGKYKYTAASAGAADSFTTRLRNIFASALRRSTRRRTWWSSRPCPVWGRQPLWRSTRCVHLTWSVRWAATIPCLPS